ncbi:hypothetical protein V5N11_000440 [Cardamine amara subsp. amara]|uniref:Uncharacterized protein n=1 Tax=Cardamine amara subsp. amara TaxID=228776 RepID=A0ABD1B1M4_CARAN
MAHFPCSRKKNMAKRAWKSFTNMLKSKFKGLQIATSVRDSTSRLLQVIPHRLIGPFKKSYHQQTSPGPHLNNYYSHSLSPRQRSRFLECLSCTFAKQKCLSRHTSETFAKQKCLSRHTSESNYWKISEYQIQLLQQRSIKSEEKVLGCKKDEEEEEGEIVDSMEDAWRRVVDASPHLRVDEKAEEFIHKFKQKLRMEKERSFLEFQERLIRSA